MNMCFNQTGNISTLNGSFLKLEDKFRYLGSNVSSTETDINTRLPKTWTAVDWLSVICNSDLTDKIKHNFLKVAVVSTLLYGCTTWTLTKSMMKKLEGNYTRILHAILNKSSKQHPEKNSCCTAIYHPSRRLSNLDEPDMQDTVGEVGTNSLVTYSCGSVTWTSKGRTTNSNLYTRALCRYRLQP